LKGKIIKISQKMTTTYKTIKSDTKDGVLTITISRPANRNAFTDELAEDLCEAFASGSKDPDVKVVVFTGDPKGQAFCAGADLSGNGEQFRIHPGKTAKKMKRPTTTATHRDSGGTVGLAILNSTKPVICCVNGPAVGVGMTMACCCDMRVVVADAKVGFPFVRRGLACETISSWTLPKLIGMGHAQELVLTGRVFPAKDAPVGLFNYTVPSAEAALKKAYELAKEIRDNCSPFSLALSRTMLIRNATMTPEEAHLVESKAIRACVEAPDNMEGIMSFLEKRAPQFKTDGWSTLPDFFPWWLAPDVKAKL
jgi:enoyl-CoA hydratase/carnithine racemase